MKKNFCTLLFTPLLFVGCDTLDTLSPAPVAQTRLDSGAVDTQVANTQYSGGSTDIKYISKPIVMKRGLLHIDTFMGTLKPTLENTLAQDDTQEIAMGTCSSVAMQMTNDYNNISPDVKVRRTALKYRNPANKPDAIDTEVMYRLQAVNDGKPVAVDTSSGYRVYKPLKIKSSCISCHGDTKQMSSEVLKMIKTKYPQDLATGFKLGDFRGVVVAEFSK